MTQYVGKVIRLNRGGTSGFIEAKSATYLDKPLEWDSERFNSRDIFVHNDDCDISLFKGARVTFEVEQVLDKKKQRYSYRAKNVSVSEFKPSIEMHFDTSKPISHPVVEMRICYSRLMHAERTRRLAEGYGYAFLLIKHQGPNTALPTNREVFSAGDAFRFVEFNRPGKWYLTLLLVRTAPNDSYKNNSFDLQERLDQAFVADKSWIPGTKHLKVWEDPDYQSRNPHADYKDWPFEDRGKTKAIAIAEVEVDIPEGIFAPEPPQWLKDYAVYFFKGRSADQCRFRRRYPLMVVQTPFYLALEGGKRIGHGIMSLAQMMDMRKGGFQNLLGTCKPALRFHPMTPDRTRDDNNFFKGRMGLWSKKYGWAVTPLAGFVLYAAWKLLLDVIAPVVTPYLKPLTIGFGNIFVLLGITALALVVSLLVTVTKDLAISSMQTRRKERLQKKKDREIELTEKKRENNRKQAALQAESQAALLVCGGDISQSFSFAPLPEEVMTLRGRFAALRRAITLEPIPEELRTSELRFQAVKRVVCAPFRG